MDRSRRRLTSNASKIAQRGRRAVVKSSKILKSSAKDRLNATTAVVAETYNNVVLSWKNNGEFSRWLTDHLSKQRPTPASEAMDDEYLRTHIGGGWHRPYDGGHTLEGSWNAVKGALPDLGILERIGTWANEYWKDLITSRGMPIIALDYTASVSEYFKHLDCVNVAQLFGGELTGISIYCNWNDPAKLIASAAATDCGGLVYANVVAPLVGLIGLGRAFFLLNQSEQGELRDLIEPSLKGLTRGASILLITVLPGGFLLHLSGGIVIGITHRYVWDKGSENKEIIISALKGSIQRLNEIAPKRRPLIPIEDQSGA